MLSVPALAAWVLSSTAAGFQGARSARSADSCYAVSPTPGYDRIGSDLEAKPIDGNASDCATRCCRSDACEAYVFGVAPFQYKDCAKGQTCCFLKDAVPQPSASTVAGIASGVVHHGCDAQAPQDGYDRIGGDLDSQRVEGGVAACAVRCCGTVGCHGYVFAVAPGRFGGCSEGDACCYLKGGDVKPTKSRTPGITTASVRVQNTSCSTELDCELSGQCVGGACVCDPGWSGEHCTRLVLQPNEPGHYAYRHRAPDSSLWNSWGSSQPIRDQHGKYHLLATRVLNGCNVGPDYTFNQDLVHAVSDSLLGPYEYRNVAVNTTVINPTVVVAPNGTFVLFYSGEPLPAHFHKNCSSKNVQEPPGPPGYVNIGCVLSIATSDSWDRPFDVRLANFTPAGAEHLFCRTNPSAWIFPNGTTLLYFRSAEKTGHNEQIRLATAPHHLGPYTLYGDEPLFPVHNEDPFVFRNTHGHFIMMLHKSHWGSGANGAKAFSYDGLDWHYTDESMGDVWDSSIEYTDGSVVDFHRREEPKIYVENGTMLAMFNAVNDRRESRGTSYVMSQAIGPSKAPSVVL